MESSPSTINMETAFEQKVSLSEKKTISLTLEEVNIKSRLTTQDMRIFLPKEIMDFILDEDNFSECDSDVIAAEKKEELSKSFSQKELNLESNPHIQDMVILKALLAVLGSVNEKNDFTQMTTDDYMSNVEKDQYITSFLESGYQRYISRNLELIFGKFKMKDLKVFFKAAAHLGVNLESTHFAISREIKKFIQSKNKILIVITPSNNFWVKSEKMSLGTKNYDKRLNNYSVLFYNWQFIQKFYDRIGNHPRSFVGFLNSMINKNLKSSIECIPIQVKNFNKYILFDQNSHDQSQDNKNKPVFTRNLNKMIQVCNSYEGAEFNETNILTLESEKEKAGNTADNMIPLNIFSEEYFTFTPDEQKLFDLQVEKVFDYLEKLLDTCDCDVREYLANNPFN